MGLQMWPSWSSTSRWSPYTRECSRRPTTASFALLLVLGAFLRPLNELGFEQAYLRFYYDGGQAERRQLTGTVVIVLIVSNAILLAVFAIATPWMSRQLLGSVEYVSAVAFLLLTRVV